MIKQNGYIIKEEPVVDMIWLLRVTFVLTIGLLASCSIDHYPSILQDGRLLMTVNIKDMTVTFIDMEKEQKVDEWKMDRPYIGGLMLPDGDTLLLYGKQVDTIDLFSLTKGEKISSWETGIGIVNGKLLKNQKEIVFADQSTGTVRFFTLDGDEIAKVKTDVNPLTLFEDQENERLFVISYSSESMTVVDVKSKEKISSFQIHPSATGALLREEANEIWIGGHGEGAEVGSDIYVYDQDKGELKKKIHAPIMPINFAQKDSHVFALSHGSNTLYKFDTSGNVIDSLKIGANPFEIIAVQDSLIIAGYDSDDVHLVDPDSLTIKKTIPVGKGPFQLILRERIER